jgi:hypothetical protein
MKINKKNNKRAGLNLNFNSKYSGTAFFDRAPKPNQISQAFPASPKPVLIYFYFWNEAQKSAVKGQVEMWY